MRNRYWHDRCERWGAWRVGAKGATIAPWARMRDGTPMATEHDNVPELRLEERETAELIDRMPEDMAGFLRVVYPWQARIAAKLSVNRQTFNERLNIAHRMLGRMLDQRRRGEELNAERRRPRHRIKTSSIRNPKGRRVAVAAVQVES